MPNWMSHEVRNRNHFAKIKNPEKWRHILKRDGLKTLENFVYAGCCDVFEVLGYPSPTKNAEIRLSALIDKNCTVENRRFAKRTCKIQQLGDLWSSFLGGWGCISSNGFSTNYHGNSINFLKVKWASCTRAIQICSIFVPRINLINYRLAGSFNPF